MNYESAGQLKILLHDMCRVSGINQVEAERALEVMIGFLSARLPSPVMGRIHDVLFEDRGIEGPSDANS
jgi:hypothetical protein